MNCEEYDDVCDMCFVSRAMRLWSRHDDEGGNSYIPGCDSCQYTDTLYAMACLCRIPESRSMDTEQVMQ